MQISQIIQSPVLTLNSAEPTLNKNPNP